MKNRSRNALAVLKSPKMLLHIGLQLHGGQNIFSSEFIVIIYSKTKQFCSKDWEF